MKKTVLIFSVLVEFLSLSRFAPKIFAQDKPFTYQFASNTVDITVGMKTQYRNGVYDGISNTTYIVYPSGIYGQYSACNPYIRAYNHKTHTWSNEVLIDNSFEWQHDNHNYPQILIDRNGYIHVFSFGHGTPIVHATSVNPRDISSWKKEILRPNDKLSATYPAAYKAKNGDFYVFFRQGLAVWHEPETVLKSMDNGKTWTIQRIIDPFYNADGWNTIYVKGLYYSPDPEGIHITFGIHKDHNTYFNKHYYVFYSFSNNHIYSVSGVDFGTTIDRNEIENCPECLILDYGHDMLFDLYATQPIAISLDKSGSPQIYYTYLTGQNRGILHIKKWNKDTKSWQDTAYPELGDIVGVNNTEYDAAKDTTDLYIRVWEGTTSAPTYLYRFDGSVLTRVRLFFNTTNKIHFNSDYHPEIKYVFGNDSYHGWNTPLAIGSRIAAGERDLSQANSCPTSQYYTNMVWSGNPYFQYPITQPCLEYSIGSSLPANGELYSTLIPVQPNTKYKVNYSVKTEELTSVGAQYPGSVIISEYNSSAKEGDALTANRVHDGRRDNVPTVTGTNDWTSKNYTFTTTANTAYVRIRLINAGWGETKGRVYFKDVHFEKMSSADINGDGKVDIFDYNILVTNFGTTGTPGWIPADITKDGKVDIFDYNILVRDFGK